MDDDPREIVSPVLKKPDIQKQKQRLERIVKEAEKRVDFTVANDPAIRKAIQAVEHFLIKSKRVCYGGQAINALLSKERKFYDEKYTIPDYDFFTPTMEQDVEDLMSFLEAEGFTEISKKLSVHEGTIKIYVNYIPVADCSQMNPEMFKIIQKRAKSVNGILYCDADLLRMFMYLEISRPRGEVARWSKVFDRLTLLNHEYPVSEGGSCDEDLVIPHTVSAEIRAEILELCVKRKSVMMGPEFVQLLGMNRDKISLQGLSSLGGPLIFMSSNPHVDAEDIKHMMGFGESESESGESKRSKGKQFIIKDFPSPSDHIYDYVTVSKGGNLIAMILKENSCHAYTTLNVDGADMRVGTPDLLLNYYYTVLIFGSKRDKSQFNVNCVVRKLYEISEKARDRPTQFVPAFGLRCSGHQKGIATLLKLKAERTHKVGSKKQRLRRSTRKRKL